MTGESSTQRSGQVPADTGELNLQRFYPYRLVVLSEEISQALAQLYSERFDLTRPEWRVMAALVDRGELAAKDIATYSTLDKMQVSRAVARLEAAGHVVRTQDPGDRRRKTLRLSAKGHAIYRKITPLALAREAFILSALNDGERAALDSIVDKLLVRARALRECG